MKVNKFSYIFATLRHGEENFSAHLSASGDGNSLPLRRQFLSGEERILAAGVAEVSKKKTRKKREKERSWNLSPFFTFSLLAPYLERHRRSKINKYVSSMCISSDSTRFILFLPSPPLPSSESLTRYTFTRQHENSTFKFSPRNTFVTFPLWNVLLKCLLRKKGGKISVR